MISRCPRCGARALVRESDQWGTYRSCFTCGNVIEQPLAVAIPLEMPRDKPRPGRRGMATAVATSPLKRRTVRLMDMRCRNGHTALRQPGELDAPCSYQMGPYPCGARMQRKDADASQLR